MTCLCGCGRRLPEGHEWFATNVCVQFWQEANTVRSDQAAVVVPFPLREVV